MRNHLHIGTADFTEKLKEQIEPQSLLIDDGPIAEEILHTFPEARVFNPRKHSFNPLAGLDYRQARAIASALYATRSTMSSFANPPSHPTTVIPYSQPQPCDEANKGFGVEPDPDCSRCQGAGFYYMRGWARTCVCKNRSQ